MNYPIIFFDGVCNLCNNAVIFIIRNDKKGILKFTSLQSEYAEQALLSTKINITALETFVLFESNKIYTKSTAALRVARHLRTPYNLFYIFIIIPAFIRDAVYNLIARNRYKWFGRRDTCMMPSAGLEERFLQ